MQRHSRSSAIVIVSGSDDEGDREHFKNTRPRVCRFSRTYHPPLRRDQHFEVFLCPQFPAFLLTTHH